MRRSKRSRPAFVACAAVAALGVVSLAHTQDPTAIALREGLARRVYITATSDKGLAVGDLTPDEITLKEDGATRKVLSVGPAVEPLQIVLLVDDSGPGIQYVREGVVRFINAAGASAQIAIITTAKQNTVLLDFTSDRGALLTAVNRLMPRTTTGGYLLEAIAESARTLVRREAVRPVIVVLALEGTEYSNLSAPQVLDEVRKSRAIVHVVSVGKPSIKTMTSWNQRPTDSIHEALDETMARSAVFAEAPRRSGGRLEQVGQATGIPTRLAEVAYELRDQLAVVYASPPGSKPEHLEVTTRRKGVKVRAAKYP